MCDCEGLIYNSTDDQINNIMEGGYYVPLLSSSIITTFLALAAFFYLKKKADKDLKKVGHECSNLKECLRRGINLYHILGMTKADIKLTADQIKEKITPQFQGVNVPKTCKPLFDVASNILTDQNKKASYDIALEMLKFHFEFPKTPTEFMELCKKMPTDEQTQSTGQIQQEVQTSSNVTTQVSHQPVLPQQPVLPHQPVQALSTVAKHQQTQSAVQVQRTTQQLVQSSTGTTQQSSDTPEGQQPDQYGGYTNNDKLYHQKYLKYKQKYMQLLKELTY